MPKIQCCGIISTLPKPLLEEGCRGPQRMLHRGRTQETRSPRWSTLGAIQPQRILEALSNPLQPPKNTRWGKAWDQN